MKIRLLKPLVQIGRIVPAGVILSDAPPVLMRKLVIKGAAEWVDVTNASKGLPEAVSNEDIWKPAPVEKSQKQAVATRGNGASARKKVKNSA